MEREKLIKALEDAFQAPHEHEEAAKMPEHPDAFVVNNLTTSMAKSGKKDIEIVGRELLSKYRQAVEDHDEERVEHIISLSKELFYRIESIPAESQSRAIAYMIAVDKIKEL